MSWAEIAEGLARASSTCEDGASGESRPTCTIFWFRRTWPIAWTSATCSQLQESVVQTREYEEEITMQDRLLRRREVEGVTGMSRASIYRLMRSGSFPLPLRVGATAVRWKESDVAEWIESRPLATGDLGSTTAA